MAQTTILADYEIVPSDSNGEQSITNTDNIYVGTQTTKTMTVNGATKISLTKKLNEIVNSIPTVLSGDYLPLSGGTLTGNLTAPSLSVTGTASFTQLINGNIAGNAGTATKLLTPINITIGATTKSFDGTLDLDFSNITGGSGADGNNYITGISYADDPSGLYTTITRSGLSNLTASIPVVSNDTHGVLPPLSGTNNEINNQAKDYVLSFNSDSSTIVQWKKLPNSIFKDEKLKVEFSNTYKVPIVGINAPGLTFGDVTSTGIGSDAFTYDFSNNTLSISNCSQRYDSNSRCLKFIFS